MAPDSRAYTAATTTSVVALASGWRLLLSSRQSTRWLDKNPIEAFMLVTLLRHGQSEQNAGLTSFLDSQLTGLGELQAEATADRLEAEGVQTGNTVAFVSPFQRTLQTLSPTISKTGIRAELFTAVCEYFSHRNDGYRCFVGLSPDQIESRFPWAKRTSRFGIHEVWWPEELEDVDGLYQRACRVRDELTASFLHTDTQVLIVSHADPIGRMIEAFTRVSPNYERPPWSENCGITRLKLNQSEEAAEVIELNDASHLDRAGLRSPV